MIREIDDFVVDRIYQPIADMLSDCGSSGYKAGMSLAVGALVVSFVSFCLVPIPSSGVILVLTIPACHLMYQQNSHNENAQEGTIPSDRLHYASVRVFVMFLFFFSIVQSAGKGFSVTALLHHAATAFMICSMYFAACVRNPPRRRFTRLAEDSV
jgi:hypothetical protein